MSYRVRFAAHCGMKTIDTKDLEKDEARRLAASILRRRRNDDHPISTLEIGTEWEVEEPDGCCMVPDTAGMLFITEEPEDPEEWDGDDDG
jgi:hypothetical protein